MYAIMNKPTKTEPVDESRHQKPPRTRKYTFPDIEKGGKAVTIEATSIEEATALFQKGQA
jgi:hypothetical protein